MIPQAHSAEPFAGLTAPLAVTEARQKIGSHLHVLLSGKAAQEVVPLKDHADALPQPAAIPAASLGQGHPQHLQLTVLQAP